MRVRLVALPFVALALASIDTILARRAMPHRPADPELLLQAIAIWGVFALIAFLPAKLLARLLSVGRGSGEAGEAREGSWIAGPAVLALCTALPVIAHGALASHIESADDLAALSSARPWVELGIAVGAAALIAFVVTKAVGRLPVVLGIAFVLGLSASVGLQRPGSSEDGFAAGGSSPAEENGESRPNLLLLVWDTTRAKSLATYGYDRPTTPLLSGFADRALVFEEARSVSSFTYTSHLSMLTGVYPSHHGGRLTRMTYDPERTPSIASLLNDAGYRTGAFVGTGVLRANTGMVEGFEVFDDLVDPPVCDTRAWKLVHDVQAVLAKLHPAFRGNGNPHWIENFQRPAQDVLANALEWIERDDPRPWFCMVNLYDVHWPYLPRGEGREKFVRPYDGPADGYLFRSDDYHLPPGTKKGARLTADDDRHLLDLYDAEMFDLDQAVGEFLAAVDAAAERVGRSNGVLMTSDHGEAFGELDTYGHHGVLEPHVRIPMMLVHPSVTPGRATGRVSGIDVGVTLLSLAGLPIPEHMTGLDLTAPRPDGRVVLVEHRDTQSPEEAQYSVYRGQWKLTRTGTLDAGKYALFDLASDPGAEVDVAAEHPERVEELAGLLEETQAGWGAARETWSAPSDAPGDHLKALGYGGGDDE